MTETEFRRIALALEGAVESAHMGHPDFRAHGRIFASLKDDRLVAAVMLTPEQQREFISVSTAFSPESGAWGRGGWTRVTLADVTEDTIGEAMTLAWQNAAAKAKRPAPARAKATGSPARSKAKRTAARKTGATRTSVAKKKVVSR